MFSLVPLMFKMVTKGTAKACIFIEISICVGMVISWLTGLFADFLAAVFFSGTFLMIIPLSLIPCFLHYKTSQSSVEISMDCIRVLDAKGKCWREIPYDSIHDIRIETIIGAFYGEKDTAEFKYICVFLNGNTQIPEVSYAKLYKHKDFFMMYYDERAFTLLQRKVGDTEDIW